MTRLEHYRAWRTEVLLSHAQRTFDGDEDAAREWFHQPSLRLGNRSPSDLVNTDAGVRLVETALGALDSGLCI